MATNVINNGITPATTFIYGNNISHYILAITSAIINVGQNIPQYTKQSAKSCGKKHLPQYSDITFPNIIWLNTCHNKICQYMCPIFARHTFTHTPSWVEIILGEHFPQTRRSHDRDLAKACLLLKFQFCSREH